MDRGHCRKAAVLRTSSPPITVEHFRAPVHGLSDWIVEQLVRTQGISSSKLAFIRKQGTVKEIYIADYDGHSSTVMPITNFGSITLSQPGRRMPATWLMYLSARGGGGYLSARDLRARRGAVPGIREV